MEDAEHEETAPDAATLVVGKLACSLVGITQTVKIVSGSLLHQAHGQNEVSEQFVCNYGLNPKYRETVEKGQLNFVGFGLEGEVRALEVSDHPFYVGTLYQPQLSSAPDRPHPLMVAYLKAVLAFSEAGK